MAHPKRKHSTQRTRKRRTHQKIAENFGDLSGIGGEMGYQHRVDPITGMYKGKQVLEIKTKKEKTEET